MNRRAILLWAALAPTASALSVAAPSSAVGMATDGAARRNVRVVEDALRVVFSEHRVDQVDTYFAEDFVQYSPYAPPGGRDALKAWWAGFVYAVPDVTTTVIRPAVAQGQDVAVFRIVTGTIMHDLTALGITGHGQHLEFRAADIFQVRAGMIVAHWETVDTGPLVQLAAAG